MQSITRLPVLTLVGLAALAAQAHAEDRIFVTDAGAIRGYDAVAYHNAGKAIAGDPAYTFDWEGATWRFSSAANRDAFAADPVKYAPAYGGYCAYGTSNGYKVSTAPEAFAIEDGKLYLNYSIGVQKTWNKDRKGYIEKADNNWVTLQDEAYESDEATITKQSTRPRN